MKFDVHVCLVSGQPTPNFVPILADEFRPQKVILVVTPKMQQNADALQHVIKQRCQIQVQQIHIENEYDTADIGERLLDLLADEDKEKVALNVTGGTKLMAFGAYKTFSDLGYPVFYWTEKGKIQILDSKEMIELENPKIRIEDYLALHGFSVLEGKAKRQINTNWLPVAQELIQARNSLGGVLGTLNFAISKAKEHNPQTTTIQLDRLDNQNLDYLIQILEKHQLASFKDNVIRFESIEARDYIAGAWFEEYVFDCLKKIPNIQDCAMGVQIDSADLQEKNRNELDVVVMYNNSLHILECKTINFQSEKLSNAQRNEPIYKLETLKKLGGLKTRKALISYRALTGKAKHMKKRAEGSEIHILETKDLGGLSTELTNWFMNKGNK